MGFATKRSSRLRRSRPLVAGAAVASGLFLAQHAHGEDRPGSPLPETSEVLGADVIVTARKRAEPLAEAPIAVTAIDGEQFNARQRFQLEDLNALATSINVSYFNPRGNYISIRGIGHSPASDGLESSVGVFLDGVYLGRSGMAVFDLADIDRIEILKGPQGALFGKNTTAGAITLSTKPPAFHPGGSLEASIGDYGYGRLRGTLTGPVLDGQVALRLSFYATARNGWVADSTTGTEVNGDRRAGARLQLMANPVEGLKLRVIVEHNAEHDTCCALVVGSFGPPNATYLSAVAAAKGGAVLAGSDYRTADDAPNHLRVHQSAVTVLADYASGKVNIDLISGYRNWRYGAAFDADGSSADVYKSASVPTYDWQVSHEIRLSNAREGEWDWTAGLYLFQQRLRSDTRLMFGASAAAFLADSPTPPSFFLSFNNLISHTRADIKTDSAALFGQAIRHFGPQWSLTAGFREVYEQQHATVDRPLNAAQSAFTNRVSVFDFDPSGNLALSYRPQKELNLYLAVARGVKAGGVNPVVLTVPSDARVKSETTDSLEVGLKWSGWGRRAEVDADLFQHRIHNYQATLTRDFAPFLTNVGTVSTEGLEARLAARPVRGLALAASGSYNEAVYISYPNAPCAPEAAPATTCNLSGRPVSDAPRWIGIVSADYRWTLAPTVTASVSSDYAYRSHYFGNIDDSRYARLGDVGTLNLHGAVTLNRTGVTVSVSIKNLTDARHLESYPQGGTSLNGAYFGTVAAPRTISASVAAIF